MDTKKTFLKDSSRQTDELAILEEGDVWATSRSFLCSKYVKFDRQQARGTNRVMRGEWSSTLRGASLSNVPYSVFRYFFTPRETHCRRNYVVRGVVLSARRCNSRLCPHLPRCSRIRGRPVLQRWPLATPQLLRRVSS